MGWLIDFLLGGGLMKGVGGRREEVGLAFGKVPRSW